MSAVLREVTPEDGIVEFVDEVCGIYFRSVLLPRAGMRISQHTHDHDHATLIGSGSARMYLEGVDSGTFTAGQAAPVLKNRRHSFEALEDNTRLTCVHDVSSAASMKAKGI